MNEARCLDALNNASSLELFRLSTVIDRLLADPQFARIYVWGRRSGSLISN
jgi:hypothetical protein